MSYVTLEINKVTILSESIICENDVSKKLLRGQIVNWEGRILHDYDWWIK